MLPPPALLPDVLPTDRLTPSGRPVAEIRSGLRRVDNIRSVWTVAGCWLQIVLPLVLAIQLSHPAVWVVAFLVAGRNFARLSILAHEAAHRLLFTNRSANDAVGRWLL